MPIRFPLRTTSTGRKIGERPALSLSVKFDPKTIGPMMRRSLIYLGSAHDRYVSRGVCKVTYGLIGGMLAQYNATVISTIDQNVKPNLSSELKSAL